MGSIRNSTSDLLILKERGREEELEDPPGASLLSENHKMKGMTRDGVAFHLDDVFRAPAIKKHSAVF